MNPLLLSIPALVCSLPAQPTTAVRGLAAHLEVDYAPRLRARADQTPNSPILVRVSPTNAANRQRIEFIGAVAGTFDLRTHLEREDGQPITDLSPLPVTIVSRLPADHGVDLYATTGSWMNWRENYREIMWAAVALWVAVPVAVLLIRAARRPRPAPALPPPPPLPTVAHQLRALLDIARARSLTVQESGQLELLLFRFLDGDKSTSSPPTTANIAATLRDLRAGHTSGPLVLAIERWLHAEDGGEDARASAALALDQLRRGRLQPTHPAEAAL